MGFDLRVTENGTNEARATWRIIPESHARCRMRITANLMMLDRFPAPIAWLLFPLRVKSVFGLYLSRAMEGLVHHAETGESVSRNQFGHHPLFSPAV